MKASNKCIELIKHFESLHDGDLKQIGLQPKMCPSGIWTEGYGSAITDKNGSFVRHKENKALAYSLAKIKTEEEAIKELYFDLKTFERIVTQKVSINLNQNQFDALVSYTYNTGGSGTLFNLINNNAPKPQIVWWFNNKYITGDGVILAGLIKRRQAECELFYKSV